MYDCIIVGGSAAGSAAAVYLARRKINFKLVTIEFGGEVARSGEIENWPGITHTTGIELAQAFRNQLDANKVIVEEGVKVEKITKNPDGTFSLTTDNAGQKGTEQAKSVIVTTGVHPRELNIENEQALRGKGVTYCTVCDGPLYRGKTVAVVGGGNSALEAGIMMASLCPKVYILTINPEMQGETVLLDKLKASPNVEIIGNAQTQKVFGEQAVSGLEYKDKISGTVKKLDVQGIFVHIGFIPNSQLVDEILVDKSEFGSIKADMFGKTKTPGLFVAGDVIDFPHQQIAIAAGQGVTAALTCISYLNSLK